MRTSRKLVGVAAGAAAMITMAAGPALAADGTVSGTLSPVAGNGSTGSGTAKVTVSGTNVTVVVSYTGLLAGSPHAGHIHFSSSARHSCPSLSDDKNGDGHINVTEGTPAYGAIVASLTTSGDNSPSSALAIDRFPSTASASYTVSNIKVDAATASAILAGQSVIVIHGVDYNGDGKYDGSTKSDIAPSLPTEATDPALCGVVSASPSGGMATGEGGAQGGSDGALIALGSVVLLGAAGTGVAAARRRKVQA